MPSQPLIIDWSPGSNFQWDTGVTGNQGILPSSIASAEAFGTPSLSGGAPDSIFHPNTTHVIDWSKPSAYFPLMMTETVSEGRVLIPSGIASGQAFGTPSLTPGSVTIFPTGIASAQSVGSPILHSTAAIAPSGIASAQALGTPTLHSTASISPSGIASAQAFGTPVVSSGGTIAPSGIASAQAFGTPVLAPGAVLIVPIAIASGQVFGVAVIASSSVTLVPSGIASAQAFGNPTLHDVARIAAVAINSAEVFGSTALINQQFILPGGIASGQAFGFPVLAGGIVILGSSFRARRNLSMGTQLNGR
jgi:hypothetical protein